MAVYGYTRVSTKGQVPGTSLDEQAQQIRERYPTAKALYDEKRRQRELGITCKTVIDGYTDFIFFNRYGNPYQPAAINREIARLVRAHNDEERNKAKQEERGPLLLPNFSCHQLRHTFCTRLCENETNIKVIQDVMGHTDIRTTMEIYAEAQDELKERTMQSLAGKLGVY